MFLVPQISGKFGISPSSIEMANKSVPVGITRTLPVLTGNPRFDWVWVWVWVWVIPEIFNWGWGWGWGYIYIPAQIPVPA